MFYIDIRKTFIYNNDKYSSKRSENDLNEQIGFAKYKTICRNISYQ